jgi:hypothetical protein
MRRNGACKPSARNRTGQDLVPVAAKCVLARQPALLRLIYLERPESLIRSKASYRARELSRPKQHLLVLARHFPSRFPRIQNPRGHAFAMLRLFAMWPQDEFDAKRLQNEAKAQCP